MAGNREQRDLTADERRQTPKKMNHKGTKARRETAIRTAENAEEAERDNPQMARPFRPPRRQQSCLAVSQTAQIQKPRRAQRAWREDGREPPMNAEEAERDNPQMSQIAQIPDREAFHCQSA